MRAALEKRVDQLIAPTSPFDLRRQTLESMTDDYLVQQAADKQKLTVPEYLKKEFAGKDAVTDAEAKRSTTRTSRPAPRRTRRSNRN